MTMLTITTADLADHTRQIAVDMFNVICAALAGMPDTVTANDAADQLAVAIVAGLDQEVAKLEDQA